MMGKMPVKLKHQQKLYQIMNMREIEIVINKLKTYKAPNHDGKQILLCKTK